MYRLIAIVALMFAAMLSSTSVQAEIIKVNPSVGDNLMDACFGSPDSEFVATKKGTYKGCCSRSLGYCVLCPADGACYKFAHTKTLTEFQKDFAPDGNLIADDKLTRPSQATVRDHRTTEPQVVAPSEKRLNLRIGQPLKLAGGKSLILRPGGILEIVGKDGLVDRRFRDATIIEDRSGVIWILAARKRWRVGLTQEQADLRRGVLPTEERLIPPNNL